MFNPLLDEGYTNSTNLIQKTMDYQRKKIIIPTNDKVEIYITYSTKRTSFIYTSFIFRH